MKNEEVSPNGYDCQECSEWDDINGCWANITNLFKCPTFIMDILDPDYEEEDSCDSTICIPCAEDILFSDEQKKGKIECNICVE